MQTAIQDDWMDSALDIEGRNLGARARLTFTVKVFLQREPAQLLRWRTPDGWSEQQTIEWGNALRGFRNDLKRVVEEGWNGKLWLEPDRQWLHGRGERASDGWTPSIALGLQVEFVPRASAHVVIRCHRLPEPTRDEPHPFARSSMQGPYQCSNRRRSARGGVTHGTLDSRDVVPKDTGQIAAVHEFGHYIGLQHVNAASGEDGWTSDAPYGVGYQRGDIMGAGTRVEGWHAYPWCRRLRRHLGGSQPQGTGWHREGRPMVWETGASARRVLWRVRTGNHAYPSRINGPEPELVMPE